MKTDEEIFEEGKAIAGHGSDENYRSLVILKGQAYPFLGTKMLNPLDPVELLCSICQVDENYESDEAVHWARCICNTVQEAWRIRRSGYSIITRYKSGAPRVVLDAVTNNVIILGELCSKKGFILPILSTQLADAEYRQDNVAVWKERGFVAPPKYDVHHNVSSWDDPDIEPECSWKRRTLETWEFGGYRFSIIKVEAELMDVSDSDSRDFDYEGVEDEYFRLEKEEPKTPSKTERPKYVWQDKGVTDED